jgi:hypothetical protein
MTSDESSPPPAVQDLEPQAVAAWFGRFGPTAIDGLEARRAWAVERLRDDADHEEARFVVARYDVLRRILAQSPGHSPPTWTPGPVDPRLLPPPKPPVREPPPAGAGRGIAIALGVVVVLAVLVGVWQLG